jgi:alcohol dehydrogenase
MPTKIVFGSGSIDQIKKLVDEEFAFERLFLVTDMGVQTVGLSEKILSHFPDIPVFDAIEQNPKHSTINEAGRVVREKKPELIIGIGGGSVLDSAKAIALLANNPGGIEDYEGRGMYKFPPLPVLAIPTTCGTGSEVTWVAVVTHTERRFKMSIKGPLMFPALAVVDPDLLVTLPPSLVASTGLDALTHAIEAYTVIPATYITDLFARDAFRLIYGSLRPAYEDIKGDDEARRNIMKGSMLAGVAFGNSDVGAVHCLSEAVGSLYDSPHGVSNAIFLPFVMEFNLKESMIRYAELARIAGVDEKDDEKASRWLVQEIKKLSVSLGIPSLKDLGVKEVDFQEISQKSYQNNSNPSNPREVTVDGYLEILRSAFREG